MHQESSRAELLWKVEKQKKREFTKKRDFFFFSLHHHPHEQLLLKKCCIFINTNNKLKILLHHNIKISTSYSSKKEGTIESAQVKLHRCLKYGKQGKNNVKTKAVFQKSNVHPEGNSQFATWSSDGTIRCVCVCVYYENEF